MEKAAVFFADGSSRGVPVTEERFSSGADERVTLTVRAADIPVGAETLELTPERFLADAGSDGYYVIPLLNGCFLTEFREREDAEIASGSLIMPIFGGKFGDRAFLAVLDGMRYEAELVTGVKNGTYYQFPRYKLYGEGAYEDITVHIFALNGSEADYSGIARRYRRYQLERGACLPLSEKVKTRPALRYAVESVEIRVRMGWKPCPPTVFEQTPETEPPMFAACTFDRLIELMETLKSEGVEKAEICLVGWNKSGHDGRWPQIFPVEPALGGEEGLVRAIAAAKRLGYRICCHTNSSDAYSIAENFPRGSLRVRRDGTLWNDTPWSGGMMYNVCPTEAAGLAKRLLPRVAALGFDGLHYIDVLSIVPPRRCFSKTHPCTAREGADAWREIMRFARDEFGGFQSEGGGDYCADLLDFCLYAAFNLMGKLPPLADRTIPLYQLVYHGIILQNPSAETVNYAIKSEKEADKLREYGGRPAVYFYSKFVTPDGKRGNWMGERDMTCGTDEEMLASARAVAKMFRDYDPNEQYRFMRRHEIKPDGSWAVEWE